MSIIPGGDDSSSNWNPLDGFWRMFYPALNPRGDASPVRMSKHSPIWDLPSPFGKVDHPENKDNIPYYAAPDYFVKLYVEPEYPIVHRDPPVWMAVRNFSLSDMASYMPLAGASGPAFMYATHAAKGKAAPGFGAILSAATVGVTLGFSLCYRASEDRLQGYAKNDEDVQFWTARADYERKVQAGEINPRTDNSWLDRKLFDLFGPKEFDLESVEKSYYGDK